MPCIHLVYIYKLYIPRLAIQNVHTLRLSIIHATALYMQRIIGSVKPSIRNDSELFNFTDKCRLPYYGACHFTRECVSTEFGQNCGDCLSGLTPDLAGDTTTGPCIRKCILHVYS